MTPQDLKHIVEAAIFAASGPIKIEQIQKLFDEEEMPGKEAIRAVIERLQEDYQDRGITLSEVASGFRFQAVPMTTQWLARMWEEKPPKYSRATLETLALIAYRQPITRSEIEDIRGVSVSTNIVKSLQEREWIRVVGHRDVPGKPALYATTKEFLDYFDLKSLEELPPLAEIRNLDELDIAFAEAGEMVEEVTSEAVDEEESILSIADLAAEIMGERAGVAREEEVEVIDEHVEIEEIVEEANELEHLMHVTEDMSSEFEAEMEAAVHEFTEVADILERVAHADAQLEEVDTEDDASEDEKHKASEAESS
ncbi:MAG: SMC-Scp complex subunit ScpB [Gammaproteobacteria bacterium]|nr:SMC-Scp complex subunit ScpB [Gammaproteobacteria bacterium]